MSYMDGFVDAAELVQREIEKAKDLSEALEVIQVLQRCIKRHKLIVIGRRGQGVRNG